MIYRCSRTRNISPILSRTPPGDRFGARPTFFYLTPDTTLQVHRGRSPEKNVRSPLPEPDVMRSVRFYGARTLTVLSAVETANPQVARRSAGDDERVGLAHSGLSVGLRL